MAAECGGSLLIHVDGTTAACTEELEGRPCAGTEAAHRRPPCSCEEILGRGACEVCALESWTDDDWRHAAHVGHVARSRSRARCAGRRRHQVDTWLALRAARTASYPGGNPALTRG
jgi:hypothetical protein